MDCREVCDLLLAAEDVGADALARGPLAEHLAQCDACRGFAARLEDLERAWRAIPLGPECEQAKQAFLARLAASPATKPITRRRLLRRLVLASAASLLAGAGGWLFVENRQAEASDALLDSLLDWNLKLTQADSDEKRTQLYAEGAGQLESAIAHSHLPAEHSQVAAAMLENGKWLAAHRDPMREATRFDSLAHRLLGMARAAERRGKYQRMNRLMDQYNRAMERGFDLNVQRAETVAATDAERKQELQQLFTGWDGRVEELTQIEKSAPEPARKQAQRALRTLLTRRKKVGRS
jgi:hypothetical protein